MSRESSTNPELSHVSHNSTADLADLLVEQQKVQAEKFQGRMLEEYNRYFFPGQEWKTPRGSAVTDLISNKVPDAYTLQHLLLGMYAVKERKVFWADMGSGRALPMRQLMSSPGFSECVDMQAVDLFDYDLGGLSDEEIEFVNEIKPGMADSSSKPSLILDNAESVLLPQKADVITSLETIQYLDNPLGALSNWYNQLEDNGLMAVTAEHAWSSWMRYADRDFDIPTPSEDLIAMLQSSDVELAYTDESDWENGFRKDDPQEFRRLVIVKKPNTELRVNASVNHVWVNPSDYKAVYYDRTDEPLIELAEV